MNKTLEVLSQELILVETHIAENAGELDFHLEHELEQVSKDVAVKVDNYAYRIQKLEAMTEFWKEKAKEAKAIADKMEDHISKLKGRIQSTMMQLDKKELVGETQRFFIKKNPPSVKILDEDILPSPFKTQTISLKPNKKLIAEKIKLGFDIPGAELVSTESITIGTRSE